MKLICEISQVKKRAQEGSQRLTELMQFNKGMFGWIAKIIEESKADGSTRDDLNSAKAAFSIIFMMTGLFNQISVTGETFTAHFSQDPQEFSSYSMDLLFDSIRKK